MDDFLKMDVFFVIAALGTLALSVLGSIALWRVNRILKHLEHASLQVSRESDLLREDLEAVRQDIRAGKGKLKSFVRFVSRLASSKRS